MPATGGTVGRRNCLNDHPFLRGAAQSSSWPAAVCVAANGCRRARHVGGDFYFKLPTFRANFWMSSAVFLIMKATIRDAVLAMLVVAVNLRAQLPVGKPTQIELFPNLQRSLQLTDEQWVGVANEIETYQRFIADKTQRVAQVNRELAIEQLRPAPDPMALGVRYVEIGTICKESSSRLAEYSQRLRKILTAQQQARLAQLEAGLGLLPAISEGQNLTLIGTEVKEALPAGDVPGLPREWRAIRNYGGFPLPGCPAPSGVGFFGSIITGLFTQSSFYPNLIRYLGLTEAQVTRMISLNGGFQQAVGQRQVEIQSIRNEIGAEFAHPVPDAAVLGAKAARLEQMCREMQASEGELQAANAGVLTETQRARLHEIDGALQLLPMLSEAQQLNLNGRAPANALPPPFLVDSPFRRLEWAAFASTGPSLPGCDLGSGSLGIASGRLGSFQLQSQSQ